MRILGSIVQAKPLLVASRESHLGLRRAVRTQPVGHQHSGRKAMLLEQPAHQFQGRALVAPTFHEQVENLAFVVDCAPEPEQPA